MRNFFFGFVGTAFVFLILFLIGFLVEICLQGSGYNAKHIRPNAERYARSYVTAHYPNWETPVIECTGEGKCNVSNGASRPILLDCPQTVWVETSTVCTEIRVTNVNVHTDQQ